MSRWRRKAWRNPPNETELSSGVKYSQEQKFSEKVETRDRSFPLRKFRKEKSHVAPSNEAQNRDNQKTEIFFDVLLVKVYFYSLL